MAAQRVTVVRLFGELDDVTVERVLAIGASEAELREARGWIDGDEELEARLGAPSSPEVRQVIDLVNAFLEEEEEQDDFVPGGLP